METCLTVLLMILVTALSKDCTMKDACSCHFKDGSVVDITSLGNQDMTPRFKDVLAASEGNHYSYNPCFPFQEHKDCDQAATCILSPDLSQAVQIGDASKAGFKYDSDLSSVVVSYTSGGLQNMKVSEIILECDQSACDPDFTANGQQEGGEFRMTLKTICACPNGCDSSGPKSCGGGGHHSSDSSHVTVGGVICIAFFSILIFYFIAGAVFMKFVKKAEGKEIIPNSEFWKTIPVLIKVSRSNTGPHHKKAIFDNAWSLKYAPANYGVVVYS